MDFHEIANIFPLLQGDEYNSLRDDITANGLIEPICLYQGKIIDGRNRYRACMELGISPSYRQWDGESPTSFVVSMNLKRRHLTSSQRAMVALDIEKQLAIEAKERQRLSEGRGVKGKEIIPDLNQGQARDEAARVAKTNPHYVTDAKKLVEQAPDLAEQVWAGTLTIPKAKVEINRRRMKEVIQQGNDIRVPEGKFRTIVIDPPWKMEKILREVAPNQVGFDYPTMTLDELHDYEVPGRLADDDCHMFLWTTQKFLPDAFELLVSWDFRYVFTMVWHKAGGFQPFKLPQYNCEFVLYGRRGTPEFIETKDFFTCFDGERREHSRKPEEFYQLVARVCPGPRIDIFSCEKHDGFEQYGNEPDKFKTD